MATIEINGKTLEVEDGRMIIDAADDAGIYIPRFCYHKKLSIAANCRMCLVEVEKAPKPLPACATPVTDGMKVFTQSEYAREAQKATMEFLLINHPLDCPVCDQGGECPLQDQAMGFGKDVSRFSEKKRVVENKNIGPLISTEMTRCIHCTRCVRFGQEVAGIMELGATGRGEHMEIGAFLGMSVDSEVSGNMIDLCPVGALTSKPYRFSARSWELTNHDSVAVHDCLGSNLTLQTVRGQVKRVLPRANEAINECWLSDRDRFSYEAIQCADRLPSPLIKEDGRWQETDWESALRFAVDGLKKITDQHGAAQIGGLASPSCTLEEFYLFQRLLRGLGSGNVDHRLRQRDFRNDDLAPSHPSLGSSITDIENQNSILLVGSNIRKQQPLLGLRIHKAAKRGAEVMVINPIDYDFQFRVSDKKIAAPEQIIASLARIAKKLAAQQCPPEIDELAKGSLDPIEQNIAEKLSRQDSKTQILAGEWALSNENTSVVLELLEFIAQHCNGNLGILPEANSVAGWVAGCVPHRDACAKDTARGGLNARAMLGRELRAYILLGAEPQLDCADSDIAKKSLQVADFVIALNPYDIRDTVDADVILPIALWTETDGTFINCEGVMQSFSPAVVPYQDAKPAWKILRVLGNLLGLDEFDYINAAEVRSEIPYEPENHSWCGREKRWNELASVSIDNEIDLFTISEVPPLRIDGTVRRAASLQQTRDNPPPSARVSAAQMQRLGLSDGDAVQIHVGNDMVRLPMICDARIPDNCVYIPMGYQETATVGAATSVRVVRES